MHHELFLALLGHTGDVIERRSDGFFVRADADFLSQAQKSVLNRLLRLGFAFSYLDQFVRQAATFPSVYLHALAQAVERQLQRYSDAVVALEAKILRSRAMFPLSNLMFELEEFMEVLPELCALVSKLQGPTEPQSASCIRGSKLLSVIHRSSSSGFPRVRTCMQELLYACHRALFKQILSWMIYGEIVDPYGEFFIKKRAAVGSDGKTVSSYGNNAALLWHQQFSIDLESVPLDYFPTAVAESVFEIGKAVHILSKANEFTPREEQDIINAVSELAQRPVFDVITVEHAVEKVRRHVASRLHEEVVVKSDFVGYLHVLKGFFLLSRGEVFQTFIERSFDMMLAKPTTKSEEDVNHGIWREILRELVSEDEMWSRDFDMQLPLQTFRLKGFSSNDALALSNISRGPNGKFLAVNSAVSRAHQDETAESSGTIWWRHAQQDGSSLSSEFLLYLDQSPGSHHAALLLKNSGEFSPATLVDGSFVLDDPHARSICIEIAAERLTRGMRVVIQVKPSDVGESGTQPSLHSDVPVIDSRNSALHVRVQFARQEVTAASSKHITFKKVIAVFVNNVLVLETRFDLQQALDLHASIDEYWIGLAFSSHAQLTEWSLDKFSGKTSWTEGSGSSAKDQNALVTPRELWHALTLHCTVRWPLQLLVTPDLLRSYAHLFQFCFRLKRVAHALELAWKSNTLRSKGGVRNNASFAASALRIRMSFVVRTLELYFQVFVIENKFKKCVAQIGSAGDFDRAKRLHETFVASVVKSCYVHTKTVASALDELLGCCWQFAEYVLQHDVISDGGCELSADRVALLDQDFHRRYEFLYSVLQISEARDLLFLLDSNGFFAAERERRKRQLQ